MLAGNSEFKSSRHQLLDEAKSLVLVGQIYWAVGILPRQPVQLKRLRHTEFGELHDGSVDAGTGTTQHDIW